MKIEKATTKDIDEIIKLYADRSDWFKLNNIKQWSKYLINHPKEQFINVIENGNYYILKENDEIIAGCEISEDSRIWNDDISNSYYLYKVVTKVEHRNIGKYLFKYAKEKTIKDGKEYLRLDCLATNKKLNEIYENNGFKFVKEGYDYYHFILREWKVEK